MFAYPVGESAIALALTEKALDKFIVPKAFLLSASVFETFLSVKTHFRVREDTYSPKTKFSMQI